MFYRWLFFFLFFRATLQNCSWNTCHQVAEDPEIITAHIVPHTHDDLGWIKTVDQYYYGARPDLVPVGVQYIYNTVIDELLKNPDRKFSLAETGFLWRWVDSNGDYARHQLQNLVKKGQIEIIGGGWVQNDEASSHYVDIIDQMTLGLQKLEQLFGECGKPQTGWQIDPFGHSREMANIYAQIGYSNLYFARIHYLEKEIRLKNKSLEFNWNASDDLQESKVFTGAFFQDNYGPPEGFCWDALCGDDPIMDNPNLEEFNVPQKVEQFVNHVREQASHQKSNHVMLLMGSDFQYTNANSWYSNLDKLIKYVNTDKAKKVKVIYSTPTCYSNAVKPIITSEITEKNDDFFPYASANHSYWTGFFTSRPTFKGMIRKASQILQLSKQLDVQANLGTEVSSNVSIARKASALSQHHDAVTGTAKENVTRDYEKQLHRGISQIETTISNFMKTLQHKNSSDEYRICHLINETVCDETKANNFVALIFNSNSKAFKGTIRIPVWSQYVGVNNNSNYEVVKTFNIDTLKQGARAPFELHVLVDCPAFGYTSLEVSEKSLRKYVSKKTYSTNMFIENEYVRVNFNHLGVLENVFDKETENTYPLQQKFLYYQGKDSNDSQPSGAYIFRPSSQKPVELGERVRTEIVQGKYVSEARQRFSPWIFQTIRLSAFKKYLEFEWTVGPISKEEKNPVTKEVITRYITGIDNKQVFYTDSNGRQVLRRKNREATSFEYVNSEPVAGNYYPITSFGYMKDSKDQFTVITDRAQGLTSGADGVIDIMIHRRCFYDDHFGVEEALDEPGTNGKGLVAMGKHTVFFSSVVDAADMLRPLVIEKFNEPVISFSKNGVLPNPLQFSGLLQETPKWMNVLTLEKWNGNNLLLRVEHIYHNSEKLSKFAVPQTFDLKNLFSNFEILSCTPLKLGANRNMTSLTNKSKTRFTIRPAEILTFEIEVLFNI